MSSLRQQNEILFVQPQYNILLIGCAQNIRFYECVILKRIQYMRECRKHLTNVNVFNFRWPDNKILFIKQQGRILSIQQQCNILLLRHPKKDFIHAGRSETP